MAKAPQDEREALRQAADTVRPQLEKLLKERAGLDARIARFQSVIAAYDDACGKPTNHSGRNGHAPDKPTRGSVNTHIEAVLSQGTELEEPEIRKQMADRFATHYSRATVYSALRRGTRFEHVGKRWKLK